MEKKTAIVHAIHEYTTHEMSQFLSIDDLETLHENIESLAYGQAELYKPVRSKPDNQIKSPSLRHYAWNIGERLDISLIDRAKFIKQYSRMNWKMLQSNTFVKIFVTQFPP